MFDENVKFKYTWRPYQKRVLDNADKYLKDGKINIVAAPGSGKTVLGLELLIRLNKPVIIFAPTVTIKNQWVNRFVSLFTDKKEMPEYISTNIYDLRKFNVVTYQALHYAYKKQQIKNNNVVDGDDEIEKESKVDINIVKEYDLAAELKKNNISTIVLDEAHHLKSEWWKSLTEVISKFSDIKIISLTATPPYDVEYSEFKKYIELCGEIDETISVPELVAADNLCPHQDYIYFNMPSESEKEYIKEYKVKLNNKIEEIKNNELFVQAVKNHKYIKEPYMYEEELLENVEYYSSMLIFLNSKGISLPKDNLSILGNDKKIPKLSLDWLEILLKNIIISDRKNYIEYEEVISKIESDLNRIGIIEKKELSFSNNSSLEKYFINSIGKLDSISKIVDIENSNLKEKLRMVILTDYIRNEYLQNKDMEINKLGVFPIFINLRKTNPNINIAILTGAMFVIPKNLQENLYGLCVAHDVDTKKLNFENLSIDEYYSIVKVPDSLKSKVMSLISKLFASGMLNIIIGTKSLLGEGWDEPSINTLILASFVGSYMLSNQMRGRAIRVNKDPNKTANIWHLVCVCENLGENEDTIEKSDFNTLKRRFSAFAGIGYSSNYISSGIERLGITSPFNEEKIISLNNKMCETAKKRDEMYSKWKNAINMIGIDKGKLVENLEVDEETSKMKRAWFAGDKFILAIIIFVILLLLAVFNPLKLRYIYIILEIITSIYLVVKLLKIHKLSNNQNNIKELGKVVLNSLYRCGYISTGISRIKVVTKSGKKTRSICCYITGATEKENNIFVNALEEVLAKTINQRYIITRLNNKLEDIHDYYNVPTLLGQKKETAEVFKTYFESKVGKCDLVYTKSSEGRKLLLKARMKSLDYKNKLERKEEFIYWK